MAVLCLLSQAPAADAASIHSDAFAVDFDVEDAAPVLDRVIAALLTVQRVIDCVLLPCGRHRVIVIKSRQLLLHW